MTKFKIIEAIEKHIGLASSGLWKTDKLTLEAILRDLDAGQSSLATRCQHREECPDCVKEEEA